MTKNAYRFIRAHVFIVAALSVVAVIGCDDDKGTTPADPEGYLTPTE